MKREFSLEGLLDNLPQIVYRYDYRQGKKLIYINKACEAVMGRPAQTVLSATGFENYICTQDRRRVVEKRQQALRERQIYRLEYKIQHQNGELRCCAEEGKGIYDAEGKLIAAEGEIRDITAIKKAEKELLEDKEKSTTLIESFVSLTWETDPSGAFEKKHQLWEKYTGQREEEYKGFGWLNAIHPEDRTALLKEWNDAIKNKTQYESQARLYNQSTKKHHPFIVKAIPFFDEKGEIKKWYGANLDMTDTKVLIEKMQWQNDRLNVEKTLKETQVALQESEARFRDLLENSPLGVFIGKEENGNLTRTYTNQQYLSLVGYNKKTAPTLNDWLEMACPLEDCNKMKTEMFEALRNAGDPQNMPSPIQAKICCVDGQQRWVLLNVSKMEQDYMITFTEISKQIEAEQKLQELNIELEQRIEERTDKLEENKKLLELAIEGGEIGIWNWEIDTDRAIYNEHWAKMLGYRLEEVEQSANPVRQFTHPDDYANLQKLVRANINGEIEFFDVVLRMRNKSGNYIWVRDKGRVVEYREDGTPTRMAGVHINITKQKEAELALQKSNLRHRQFEEATQDGILIHRDGIILEQNKAFLKMTGGTAEQVNGKHLNIFMPLKAQEQFRENMRMKAKVRGQEFEVSRLDGQKIYIQIWADYLDETKNDLRYLLIRDVTERKNYEEQIRSNEEKYRTLFSTANDAIFIMDDKAFLDCNGKALEMFGCNRKDFMETAPYEFSPEKQPDGSSSLEAAFARINAAAQGQPQRFNWKHCQKDGTPFDAEVSLNAFLLHGKMYIQGIVRDISAAVAAEEEVATLVTQLQERNKQLNCLLQIAQMSIEPEKDTTQILEEIVQLLPPVFQRKEHCYARISYQGRDSESKNFKTTDYGLAAPIFLSGNRVGQISLYCFPSERKGDPFSKEESNLIETIAIQIGTILEKKKSEERMISSILGAEDRERSRIAKEIHDSLGQLLTAASLNLELVKKELFLLSVPKQLKLKRTADYLLQAIGESRNISHNLMPKAIRDYGYLLAVGSLLEGMQSPQGPQFLFYTNIKDRKQRFEPQIELALYRITQEATNNGVKHAKANNITIQLMLYPDMLLLTIEDDGIGFDVENRRGKSNCFGLHSMQNRASAISGTVFIDSAPNKGTSITVEVPLS